MTLWRHKTTSKCYEEVSENWHLYQLKWGHCWPIQARISEFFFSGAFKNRFFVWRYCKYKDWVSYFPAFMGNELGWGSAKSSEKRFTGFVSCLTQVLQMQMQVRLLSTKWNSMKLDRKHDLMQRPLPSLCFLGRSGKNGSPVIWLAETFSTSPLKVWNRIQQNLTGSKISMSSAKFLFFRRIGMAVMLFD